MNCYKTHGSQNNISLRFQNAPSLTDSGEMHGKVLGIHEHEATHRTDPEEHTARTVAGRIHLRCIVTHVPPANKKLCSTLSLPDNESAEAQLLWVPRASSVWQPVENCGRKPRSASFPDERTNLTESLGINNEMESMSDTSGVANTKTCFSRCGSCGETLGYEKRKRR